MESLPKALQVFALMIYMLLIQAMMLSPIIAIVVCVVIFRSRARRSPTDRSRLLRGFIAFALAGAAIGVVGAMVFVIAATIRSNSGNGPLALIVYGPLAASVGAIVASFVWQRRSHVSRIAGRALPRR